jgi:hypothetical protein
MWLCRCSGCDREGLDQASILSEKAEINFHGQRARRREPCSGLPQGSPRGSARASSRQTLRYCGPSLAEVDRHATRIFAGTSKIESS